MKHKCRQKQGGKRQRQEVGSHNKTNEDEFYKIRQEKSKPKTMTETWAVGCVTGIFAHLDNTEKIVNQGIDRWWKHYLVAVTQE